MSECKDLVLEEDTVIEKNLFCGNISGKNGERFSLTVKGNIDALDIVAGDINAFNIDALNIDAFNIDALNIYALNIDAGNIVCISRKKKSKNAKTIAYSITLGRFNRERKEVMPEKGEKK